MSYAVIGIIAMGLLLGSFIYAILNPAFHTLLSTAGTLTTSTEAHQGQGIVLKAWNYWPVWFLGLLLMYGYIRAVRESGRVR